MYIDSHCHLFHSMEGHQITSYLKQNHSCLSYLVDISTNVKEFLNSHSYSLPEYVLRAVGLYPELAQQFGPSLQDEFENAIVQYRPQAIGEVGLDFHWDYGDIRVQETLFRHQIETALRLKLPLIIHSRDAFSDTLRILRSYQWDIPVILHCYGYGPAEAEQFGFEGPYYFSFAGNVTYKNAIALQETARIVPIERILMETDSPYLSPVPLRGKPNLPHYVQHTYHFISELRNIDSNMLIKQTESNFAKIFGLEMN